MFAKNSKAGLRYTWSREAVFAATTTMMMIRQRNEDDDYERIWKEVRTQPTLTLKRLSINQLINKIFLRKQNIPKRGPSRGTDRIDWHRHEADQRFCVVTQEMGQKKKESNAAIVTRDSSRDTIARYFCHWLHCTVSLSPHPLSAPPLGCSSGEDLVSISNLLKYRSHTLAAWNKILTSAGPKIPVIVALFHFLLVISSCGSLSIRREAKIKRWTIVKSMHQTASHRPPQNGTLGSISTVSSSPAARQRFPKKSAEQDIGRSFWTPKLAKMQPLVAQRVVAIKVDCGRR